MHPLVEEAAKKAAIAWLRVGDRPETAVWCLWSEGALYVVSGPGEQPAPGLADADTATVLLRGDHGGRIVSCPVAVDRVEPGSPLWEQVAPQLAGKRLNASGGAAQLVARWAARCVVSRLTPTGELATTPPAAGDAAATRGADPGSLAAPPRPTPAARRTAKPFMLRRGGRSRG